MHKSNIDIAVAYYTAMGNKNSADLSKYLDADARLVGPFGKIEGKEGILNAAVNHFMPIIETLIIRAKCGMNDQVMLAYDLNCIDPTGKIPAVSLITFKNGLIAEIELFFDPRPLIKK